MHRSLQALRSVRVRAVLALGLVVSIAATGSLAAWTDTVNVDGTTLTAGRIDLQVNNQDAIASYNGLNISNMVPGNSTANVLTVKNNGNVPLTYVVNASFVDAAPNGMGAALTAKVTGNATITGTSPTATCSNAALAGTGNSFSNGLVSTPRPLAAGASENLCIQATLPGTAPSSLQGGSTTLSFQFIGSTN